MYATENNQWLLHYNYTVLWYIMLWYEMLHYVLLQVLTVYICKKTCKVINSDLSVINQCMLQNSVLIQYSAWVSVHMSVQYVQCTAIFVYLFTQIFNVCVGMSYSCKRPCKFLAESSATCARFFRKKTCMFKLSVQVSREETVNMRKKTCASELACVN